jgi:hypothetical protein
VDTPSHTGLLHTAAVAPFVAPFQARISWGVGGGSVGQARTAWGIQWGRRWSQVARPAGVLPLRNGRKDDLGLAWHGCPMGVESLGLGLELC